MTLTARSYPLTLDSALIDLKDALGANYGAETDDATLTRALARDAVLQPTTGGEVVHPRPWATAAHLIRWNTEYEVDKGLKAKIDRKLKDLDIAQKEADLAAGIADLVPDPTADEAARLSAEYASGVTENEAIF